MKTGIFFDWYVNINTVLDFRREQNTLWLSNTEKITKNRTYYTNTKVKNKYELKLVLLFLVYWTSLVRQFQEKENNDKFERLLSHQITHKKP